VVILEYQFWFIIIILLTFLIFHFSNKQFKIQIRIYTHHPILYFVLISLLIYSYFQCRNSTTIFYNQFISFYTIIFLKDVMLLFLIGYFILSIFCDESVDFSNHVLFSLPISISLIIFYSIFKSYNHIYIIFISITLISLIKQRNNLKSNKVINLIIDTQLLKYIIPLFIFIIVGYYRYNFINFQLYFGPDTWRHYKWGVLLSNNIPELPLIPRGIDYFVSYFFHISDNPNINTMLYISIFNLMLIPAFYFFSKAFIPNSIKTQILALGIWGIFGGISGIFYIKQILSNISLTDLSLLERNTYLDIGRPFGFYLLISGPDKTAEVFGVLSSLLIIYIWFINNKTSKYSTIILISLNFLGLTTHLIEVVIINYLILSYILLLETYEDILLNNNIRATILGTVLTIIYEVAYLLPLKNDPNINNTFTLQTYIILIYFTMLIIYYYFNTLLKKVIRPVKKAFIYIYEQKHRIIIINIMLFIFLSYYVLNIIHWFIIKDKVSWIDHIVYGDVPNYIYSLRFGLSGLITIIGFYLYLSNKKYHNRENSFLILSLTQLILIGKIITYININSSINFYNEYRLMTLLWIFISIITAITIKIISNEASSFDLIIIYLNIQNKVRKINNQNLITQIILILLILSSIPSSMLTISFWSSQKQSIDSDDLELANYFKSHINSTDWNPIITNSEKSFKILEYFSEIPLDPLYQYKHNYFFHNDNPEIPLLLLNSMSASTPIRYIVIDKTLQSPNYSNFIKTFLNNLNITWQNSKYLVYKTPTYSYPSLKSNLTILFTEDHYNFNPEFITAQLNYNFTKHFYYDHSFLNDTNNIIIPYDPLNDNIIKIINTSNITIISDQIIRESKLLQYWKTSKIPFSSNKYANDNLSTYDSNNFIWNIDYRVSGTHYITLTPEGKVFNFTNSDLLSFNIKGSMDKDRFNIQLYDTNGNWILYNVNNLELDNYNSLYLKLNESDKGSFNHINSSNINKIIFSYTVIKDDSETFLLFSPISRSNRSDYYVNIIGNFKIKNNEINIIPSINNNSKNYLELMIDKKNCNFSYILLNLDSKFHNIETINIELYNPTIDNWVPINITPKTTSIIKSTTNLLIKIPQYIINNSNILKLRMKFHNVKYIFKINEIRLLNSSLIEDNVLYFNEPIWIYGDQILSWIKQGKNILIYNNKKTGYFYDYIIKNNITSKYKDLYYLDVGKGRLAYIYDHPNLSYINLRDMFSYVLKDFNISTININDKLSNNVNKYKGSFYELKADGNITIESHQPLFITNLNLQSISYLQNNTVKTININNSDQIEFLYLSDNIKYHIKSRSIKINKGNGFYSNIELNNSHFILESINKLITIKFKLNNTMVTIKSPKMDFISYGPSEITIRAPNIGIAGKVEFDTPRFDRELYNYIPKRIIEFNRNIKIFTEMNFRILYSGREHILDNINITTIKLIK